MNRELLYRQYRAKRTKPLDQSIGEFFKKNRLDGKFSEAFIQSEWRNIVGDMIANQTTSLYVNGHRLVLKINSAPLRNELLMSKRLLLKNIADVTGNNKITELVFL